MSVQTSEYLKGKFSKGNYPTETDYSDLIDSCINTGITPGTEIILAPIGNGYYNTDDNNVKCLKSFQYINNSGDYSVLTQAQTTELYNAPIGTCIIVFNTLDEVMGIVVEDYFSEFISNNPHIETKQFMVAPCGSIMFVKIGMYYSGGYVPVVSMVGTAIQGNLLFQES